MRVEAAKGAAYVMPSWQERAALADADGSVPGCFDVADVSAYVFAADEAVVQGQRALFGANTAIEMQEWHTVIIERKAVAGKLWNIARTTMIDSD